MSAATSKTHRMIGSMAGTEMRIEEVVITPAIAKKWLGQNTASNRNISKGTVEAYAREMSEGRWSKTHQGIAFNQAGELVDGQHRLQAVVMSGTTITSLVFTGMPLEYNAPIDQGYNRRISQILGKSTRWVSAVRTVISMETNTITKNLKSQLGFIEECGKRNAEVLDRLVAICPSKIVPAPMVGALVFAHPVNTDKVESFAHQVNSGELLERGDPAFALRAWMIRVPYRTTRENIVACCNALAAELKGKELTKIAYGRDSAQGQREGWTGYRWLCQRRRAMRIVPTPEYVDVNMDGAKPEDE